MCVAKSSFNSSSYLGKTYSTIPEIVKGAYWSGSSFIYTVEDTTDSNNKITKVTTNYIVT